MAESGIKIRKVFVDTPGTEDVGEYVMLHNNGPNDVDLTGWRIGDTVEHPEFAYVYSFPAGFKLLNGADVKLHTGAGDNDPQNLFWGNNVPVWTNTGDHVRLVNEAEEIVDEISWPQRPVGGRVLRTAEIAEEIAAYAHTVGFGTPTSAVQWLSRDDDTEYFWREYAVGTIFHSGFPTNAMPTPQLTHIVAPIYTKYQAMGGVRKLGTPLTSTKPANSSNPGPAVFNDFADNLSIYYSPDTGARAIGGAILDRWRSPEIGGAGGSFGLPVADERTEFGSHLRFIDFEHGSIWETPNSIRAISELRVEYVGMHCFGETEWDGATGSDEVYWAVDVEPLDRPRDRPQQVDDSVWVTALPPTGPVYQPVDKGGTYGDRVVIFQGRPAPLRIKALAWEADEGDANALRGEIQGAVAAVGAVGAAVFPAASAVLLNPQVQAAVASAVNRIADTEDDFIGRGSWQVDSRQKLLEVLDAGLQQEPNIELKWHAGIYVTDGDASYKSYFELIAVVR